MLAPHLTIPTQPRTPFHASLQAGAFAPAGARSVSKFVTWAAAAPVALCFILPIVKIKGIVYLYDLATVAAIAIVGFRPIRNPRFHRFAVAWWLLVLGMVFGFTSAWSRADMTYRIAGYSAQFLLGLVFCRSFIHGALSRRIDLELFARLIAFAGLIAATMGVLQFVLLQVNPGLADQLYRSYLGLAGHEPDEYENIYLNLWRMTGQTRIIGTWSVTTTYGGMMALAGAWLLYTSWHQVQRVLMFCWTCMAVLATLSRHAWIIATITLVALVGRSRRAATLLVYLVGGGVLLILLVLAVSSLSGAEGIGGMSFLDQLADRTGRTIEENVDDGSVQARYVAGTLRFALYSLHDPMILLIGFGIQTESGLIDQSGPGDLLYGYVSNGWLLIWRNCGISGLLGLAMIHIGLLRVGGRAFAGPVIVSAVIIGSDNYSVHGPAPFLLIIVFVTYGWAKALLKSEVPALNPMLPAMYR